MACITTDLVEIHYKNPDTNSVVPSLNQEPVCVCVVAAPKKLVSVMKELLLIFINITLLTQNSCLLYKFPQTLDVG